MPERGYDSYDRGAALRQAGTSVVDSLLGRPGSVNERIRLGLIVAILVTLVTWAFVGVLAVLPVFGVVFVATTLAVTGADWLTAPYRGWETHGFVAGLTTAALFLLLSWLGVVATLPFMWRGAHPADVAIMAAIFTLLLAVPAWLLWLVWGVFRRGGTEADAKRPAWRLALAPLVIVGTILLLAAVGRSLS